MKITFLSQSILTTFILLLSVIDVGIFSTKNTGEEISGWKEMNFRGITPTEYKLYDYDGKTVVKAISNNSSSGLIKEVEIDLKEFPILNWEWKVTGIFEDGDVFKKSGDDYPARIYLVFDYDIKNLSRGKRNQIRLLRTFYGQVPTRAINYIYESRAEVGTIVENPYTDLVTMVVVDSGTDSLNEWQSYSRNVYEDYLEIFGEEPPKVIGVAIMTDSDDTGESTTTYFGDIYFEESNSESLSAEN